MTVPHQWRKSSYSATNQECVEIALDATRTWVRDTKDRNAGQLAMQSAAWRSFMENVKRSH
jgi:hypothetical protein